MKKKFLSVFLTGVMVIGSCVVTLADNPTNPMVNATPTSTIEADSQIQSPTISVALTLPTGDAAKIKANPYKLTIGTGDDAITDSLVGTSYTVTNNSNCEILLSVKGSVSVAGATKIATSVTAAETAATPTVFIQAYVKSDADTYLKVDSKTKAVSAASSVTEATPLVYAAKAVAYTGNIVMQRADATDTAKPTPAAVIIEVTGATGGVGWAKTDTADTDTFKASTVLDVAPSTSDANILRTAAASSSGGSGNTGD
jgi:hypothetical protein